MTWRTRLKLLVGALVVLVIVAGLTVVFNQRQSQAVSTTASIEANRYPVGIDYGGTVIDALVENGDTVQEGDELFVLQSPSLEADLAEGLFKPETVAYTVTNEGVITLTAAAAGTISDVSTEPGSFAQAGQVLATIDQAGSLFVQANFVLTARDYSRISDGASVSLLLPNQETIEGTVDEIAVETSDTGDAELTVKVASDNLDDGAFNGLVKRGTPVNATLSLRDDGIFAGVGDMVNDFRRKIGV